MQEGMTRMAGCKILIDCDTDVTPGRESCDHHVMEAHYNTLIKSIHPLREEEVMSIRLRLALCYGILFALILPLVTVLSYAIHTRSQYDDLDRTLVVSADHFAAEAALSPKSLNLLEGGSNLEILLRVYSPDDLLR